MIKKEELAEILERVEKAKPNGEGVGELALNEVPRLVAEIDRLQEGKDKYIAELETEVFRLQDELAGDGVLTLTEQLSHARAENDRLYNKASEYASIALWCARRLATRQYAEFAYDEIEKVYGYEVDRDWRGKQV